MKFCPKCNNIAQDGDRACGQCGAVLDQSMIPSGARVRTPTVTEASQTPPTPPPTPGKVEYRPTPPPARVAASQIPAPTTLAVGPMSGRRGSTLYAPPPGSAGSAAATQLAPQATTRRILGVLVTYSWKPEGQVFPIREGRNLIGRGEECEIRLTDDPVMSIVNTHITYRQSFTIGDMVSMSGTDLDGKAVEEQFLPLTNLARIRAGSTHFIFVVVDPEMLSKSA